MCLQQQIATVSKYNYITRVHLYKKRNLSVIVNGRSANLKKAPEDIMVMESSTNQSDK